MTVNLCVFEDLVDVAKPGDRMEVTGIYRAHAMRLKPTQKTLKSVYRTYIDVIHFKSFEKSRMGAIEADAETGLSLCTSLSPADSTPPHPHT
jgi:DNA replication licensing factor MCM4